MSISKNFNPLPCRPSLRRPLFIFYNITKNMLHLKLLYKLPDAAKNIFSKNIIIISYAVLAAKCQSIVNDLVIKIKLLI